MKRKLKKDDEVIVIAGKDKGKKGRIVKMLLVEGRVIVQGINMIKRHERPAMGNAGGIVEKEAALHISNVALVDPKTGKGTRVGYTTLKDGTKARIARRSGETING